MCDKYGGLETVAESRFIKSIANIHTTATRLPWVCAWRLSFLSSSGPPPGAWEVEGSAQC